jgi:chromosome segregation ATPase
MNTQNNSRTRRSTPTKAELEAMINELKAALKETEKAAQDKDTAVAQLQDALKEAEKAAQDKDTAVAELKASLEESHKKEDVLQREITELYTDLHHQQESIEKLEKELGRIGQLKTELEQVKTAAIQLAQTNEKLLQEINTLRKEKEDFKGREHKVTEQKKAPEPRVGDRQPGRPIQKESDKPADFAKNTWLL